MSRNIRRLGATDAVIDSQSAPSSPTTSPNLTKTHQNSPEIQLWSCDLGLFCVSCDPQTWEHEKKRHLFVSLFAASFIIIFFHFFFLDVRPFVFVLSRRDKKGRTGRLGPADLHSSPSQPCASKKSKMVCSCELTPDKTVRENEAEAASSSRLARTPKRRERWGGSEVTSVHQRSTSVRCFWVNEGGVGVKKVLFL